MKCFVIYFAFQHFVIRPLHSVELAAILFFFQKVHLCDVTILDPLVMVRISITYFVKKKCCIKKKWGLYLEEFEIN